MKVFTIDFVAVFSFCFCCIHMIAIQSYHEDKNTMYSKLQYITYTNEYTEYTLSGFNNK